jgi:hypothetical protein
LAAAVISELSVSPKVAASTDSSWWKCKEDEPGDGSLLYGLCFHVLEEERKLQVHLSLAHHFYRPIGHSKVLLVIPSTFF